MRKKFHIRGQSVLEYAVLLVIIVAVLLTVQNYVKRGIQGRFKSSTDDMGEQFSPGNTNAMKSSSLYSKTKDEFGGAGGQGQTKSTLLNKETTQIVDTAQIINVDQEYWGTATHGVTP